MRIKAATGYVKGVRAARTAVLAYVGFCLLVALLAAGFILFHVGLYVRLAWEPADKALLMMVMGGVYMAIPAIGFAILASQRLWMRATGADEAVRRALRNRPLCGSGAES